MRTIDPWHRMNLLLTNKPTRPRCPPSTTNQYNLYMTAVGSYKRENKSYKSRDIVKLAQAWGYVNLNLSELKHKSHIVSIIFYIISNHFLSLQSKRAKSESIFIM